jgi:beta-glucosidase
MINRFVSFCFGLFLTILCSTLWAQIPVYLDPSASTEARVEDLLSRMTLEEKVGQMTQADHEAVDNVQDITTYFLGSVLSGGGSDPAAGNDPKSWADLTDRFQQKALDTRLKIPLIYGVDAVHGHSNVTGAVIFPHNIGLGATRNPDLVKQAARVTAIEVAATGMDWTFAPCVAVPRDERWGRTYEGFGETPELVEVLSGALVKGFQTDTLNQPTSIVACAKHYLGDGGTEGDVDQGNTVLSEQELRAIHLPGYLAAIENDVKTIMASYSSWNGVKLHGHKTLLTDVLKKELGFKGFIVSDWRGIDQLPGDYTSDVETSINAGIDMVMVPDHYVDFFTTLVSLVKQNRVSRDRIDDAVRRILSVKFERGLFERPMADRSLLPASDQKITGQSRGSVSENLRCCSRKMTASCRCPKRISRFSWQAGMRMTSDYSAAAGPSNGRGQPGTLRQGRRSWRGYKKWLRMWSSFSIPTEILPQPMPTMPSLSSAKTRMPREPATSKIC